MIDEKIKSLVSKVTELIEKEKNSTKSKPGKMSLLSMFRHGHENSHSDVLRYLLDPKEDHKHKDEYLKLFLEEVGLEYLIKLDPMMCEIHREYPTKQGRRIDIFIEFDDKTCIIIENKIWAKDQDKQLLDYYKSIKDEKFTDIHILYLTLPGDKASKQSLGEDSKLNQDEKDAQKEMEKLEEENKFLNISYERHILGWLKQLSFKSNEHTLRSAIEQYIYNIEILTNQTEEDINMKHEIFKITKDLKIEDNLTECINLRNVLNYYIISNTIRNIHKKLESITILPNHKFIYTINNEFVCNNEEEMYKYMLDNHVGYLGAGIQILDNLSVVIEKCNVWGKRGKYDIGLMTHGENKIPFTAEMQSFINNKTKSDTGWWNGNNLWYFGKTFSKDIESIDYIQNIQELYDLVKDIK